MATLYPDRVFLSMCHRPNVAGLSMLYKVRTLITIIIMHLLYSNALLCICAENPWVLFSSWALITDCHLQLLECQVRFDGQALLWLSFLSLIRGRRFGGQCMLFKVYSNSNNCLFGELPSAFHICHNSSIKVCNLQNGFPATKSSNVEWPSMCLTPEHWMGLLKEQWILNTERIACICVCTSVRVVFLCTQLH